MRKILFFIFTFFILSEPLPAAQQGFQGYEKGQSSVSFFAGQPLFVRYSHFINWKRAWSIDGGYHFDKYPYLAANYMVYFYNIKDRLKEKSFFNSLLYYAGPGVFLGPDFSEEKASDKVKIGFRVFGGTEYIFNESPVSLNVELGPAIYIEGQDEKIGFQGMIGVTYYIGGIKKRKLKSRTTIIRDNTREIPVKNNSEKDLEEEFDQMD